MGQESLQNVDSQYRPVRSIFRLEPVPLLDEAETDKDLLDRFCSELETACLPQTGKPRLEETEVLSVMFSLLQQ